MAQPNLINTSSCLIENNYFSLTTTAGTVAGSKVTSNNPYVNKVIKVVSFYASNITASTQTITVLFSNPGNVITYLAYQVDVPVKSTLVLITKDSPVYLEEYANLEAFASTTNSIHATVVYEVYDDA